MSKVNLETMVTLAKEMGVEVSSVQPEETGGFCIGGEKVDLDVLFSDGMAEDIETIAAQVVAKALLKSRPHYQDLFPTEEQWDNAGLFMMACKALSLPADGFADADVRYATSDETVAETNMDINFISYLDWLTLSRLTDLVERFDPAGLQEGYQYSFRILNSLDEFRLPDMDCSNPEVELPIYEEVVGNCYSVNADTYGSVLGEKAQMAYLFYITDADKYAVVNVSYWCL